MKRTFRAAASARSRAAFLMASLCMYGSKNLVETGNIGQAKLQFM
jgi:hypothetical protein